jgi:hypothetical protein
MGKPKERPPVKLPKIDEVDGAKALADDVGAAKQRLAKVKAATPSAADPKHRKARKRVKRAQRRLRRTLAYAAQRRKAAAAEAPASS